MKTRPEGARKYIIYREERAQLREQGWNMTDLQRDIYEKKYRFDSETFDEFLDRVSGGNNPIKKAIKDKKFMPAGRILAGRGLDKYGRKITLSNCYVMPKVEDNIESIFDTAKYLARTYSYGGGVGLTLSKLRPKGSKVNNAASTTTGAVALWTFTQW
jgi:ribonucleoside-diphosphate reductase alpha chain